MRRPDSFETSEANQPSRTTIIILVVCLGAMIGGFVAGQFVGPPRNPALATASATG